MKPDRKVREYSWGEVVQLAADLAQSVRSTSFEPTMIIGILRGGAFPALMLSHALGVRRMYMLQSVMTKNDDPRAQRGNPRITAVDSLPDLTHERVLLVDDVTNTGSTLRAVLQAIKERGSTGSIRSACLLWDTVPAEGAGKLACCEADYWASEVHAWVGFPWESGS